MMTFGGAVWEGGIKDGKGAISTKSGALDKISIRFRQPLRGQGRHEPGRADRRGPRRLFYDGAVAHSR